jgi:hypothetical protein
MIFLGDAGIADYLKITDPGYGLLMWVGTSSGYNIWVVHLIGGGIFAYALSRFCLSEVHPWLAMTIALPYLVIVVAMGYDRQAVAIGFVMLAMVSLRRRSMIGFARSMSLAAAMHITSLILMPVLLLGSRINKLWAAIIGGPIFFVGYIYALRDKADTAIAGYIDTGYSSRGAAIRIAMNAIPAALYLIFRRRYVLDADDRRFSDVLATIALAFVVFLIVSPSSTAVDRMALYVIPIQIVAMGRLPLALAWSRASYQALVAAIVVYSGAVMLVWLIFADTAGLWVPYKIIGADKLVGLSY